MNIFFDETLPCICGKKHTSSVDKVISCKNALSNLPECIAHYGGSKVFLVADVNTYAAAGDRVCRCLEKNKIPFSEFIFRECHLEPDEKSVGEIIMNYDYNCDIIVAVGSGVINDICKILSGVSGKPYIIIATAPSMDGYASSTSSMVMNGVKVSVNSRCPDAIIGDTEILKTAPVHMLKSGLGDMLAKYISICEWRISHIINSEYYCETIASYIRSILNFCVEHASGVTEKKDEIIEAVFEGLVACGKAMDYAGISRPASGTEHYLSHIWDMRGLEFKTPTDLHGIQCAVATRYTIKLYEKLKHITPNRDKALAHANAFDIQKWQEDLRTFLGKSAETMIELEQKEKKYDPEAHKKRLEIILSNWDDILKIINEELPSSQEYENILRLIESPLTLDDIGLKEDIFPMTFFSAADIRYKYVLCHLAWDLGINDELFMQEV